MLQKISKKISFLAILFSFFFLLTYLSAEAVTSGGDPPGGFGPDWTATASVDSNGNGMYSVTIVNHDYRTKFVRTPDRREDGKKIPGKIIGIKVFDDDGDLVATFINGEDPDYE